LSGSQTGTKPNLTFPSSPDQDKSLSRDASLRPFPIAIAVTAGLVRVGDSVRGWFLRAGHHGSLTYAVNTKAFYPDLNTAVLAGDPPHGSRGLVGGLPGRAAVSGSLLGRKTQYEY
jgi:hypothetical protein